MVIVLPSVARSDRRFLMHTINGDDVVVGLRNARHFNAGFFVDRVTGLLYPKKALTICGRIANMTELTTALP